MSLVRSNSLSVYGGTWCVVPNFSHTDIQFSTHPTFFPLDISPAHDTECQTNSLFALLLNGHSYTIRGGASCVLRLEEGKSFWWLVRQIEKGYLLCGWDVPFSRFFDCLLQIIRSITVSSYQTLHWILVPLCLL